MRAAVVILAGVLLVSAGASVSRAAQLIVLEDARYVRLDGETVEPGPGASLFDASLAGESRTVAQTTTLSSSEFFGTGGDVLFTNCCIAGESVFDVSFTVDAPVRYLLNRLIHNTLGVATGFLSDSTGQIQVYPENESGTTEGLLVPELQYRLLFAVQMPGDPDTFGDWSFRFSLPEPALGLVVLLAVTALLAARGHTRFQ